MYIDTHAHYDDEAFDEDRRQLLPKLHENGVKAIINCGQDLETSLKALELANRFDFVYATAGIHPHEADKFEEIGEIEKLFENNKIVAVGETGLDYHYDFSPKETQWKNFRNNIVLAKKLDKPIVVHDREAHEDTMKILDGEKAEKVVFHCYSGSAEMAELIAKRGWYFSVGGSATFKNARRICEALKVIPIDRLMLETDCPYMSPEPVRGTRNISTNIEFTAAKIAEILNMTKEELFSQTTENAIRFFNLPI